MKQKSELEWKGNSYPMGRIIIHLQYLVKRPNSPLPKNQALLLCAAIFCPSNLLAPRQWFRQNAGLITDYTSFICEDNLMESCKLLIL